jgi:choline dehydrogenase-like flavoprotein
MPLTDIQRASTRHYDVCIIGSGPAGLSAALSLAELGYSTLLIDAGGELPAVGPDAELTYSAAHEQLKETHCRAFGGTSWMWGGRIMPFSKPEFDQQNWPIDYDTFARHLDEAALILGGSVLNRPFLDPEKTTFFDLDAVEMLAHDGPVSQRYITRLEAATGPDILLSTTAVGLTLQKTSDGLPYCSGVRTHPTSGGDVRDVQAKVTIVATGGIEAARLLLADKVRHPEILGHLGALGRSYSGHLTGSISRIKFPAQTDPRPFGWRPCALGGFDRRVFRSTSDGVDTRMNMFFWVKNWPTEDADHGSGILSAKYLASKLRAPRSPKYKSGPGAPEDVQTSGMISHLRNLAFDAMTSLKAAPDLFRAIRNTSRRSLDHLIPNRENCYKLCYHAEQEQRSDNQIDIIGSVSADKLPDIRINYDFSDADVDNVIRAHAQLAKELSAAALAELIYEVDEDDMHRVVREKARDGYHQIGTTRMGTDDRDSVVDANCKVHGVQGLYLAGSSVFRSSGAAPPTQSIVAFSLRLAHYLSGSLKSESTDLENS